jgi:hypothetical protein
MAIYQIDREYELIIGDYRKSDNAIVIPNLQCTFEISKSSSNKKKSNSATIEIYNLNDEHRALIEQEYVAAVFSAGFINPGMARLFAGQVVDSSTRKSGTEIITQVKMGSGYTDLNHELISQLAAPGQSYRDVYEEIRKSLPSVVRGVYNGTNLNNQVINGYPLIGEPRRILDELSELTQTEWRVDDGVLYVNDQSGGINDNLKLCYIISEESGLIERPYRVAGDKRRTKKDKIKKKGIQFKCLLNPRIVPGEYIKLEYPNFDGYYKVDSVRMYGDFRGNPWYSEVFCSDKVKV